MKPSFIDTPSVSDALDAFNHQGVVEGIDFRMLQSPRVVGRAATASVVDSDERGLPGLQQYLEGLGPGDVVTLGWNATSVASALGGMAALLASERGAVGAVVDGWVRDVVEIAQTGLSICCRGVIPRSGNGRLAIVDAGSPAQVGGVTVSQGDLVFLDETGVCVVPQSIESLVVDLASQNVKQDLERAQSVLEGVWPSIVRAVPD